MLQVNPNGKGLVGFNNQVDSTGIINKIMEVEEKKTVPIIQNIDKRQTEIDAWTNIKTQLEDVNLKSEIISKFKLWQNKIATSSMPEVLAVSADKNAKPGITNVFIDKIALHHQIASNVIPSPDAEIGSGSISIQIGYDEPNELVIENPTSAKEVVNRINESNLGVEAAIVQIDDTGEKYQIVLTSNLKGWKGRMTVNFDLINGKYAADFNSSYTQPTSWIYKNRDMLLPEIITDLDYSTSLPQFSGNYTGEEDLKITFRGVNDGTVGALNQLNVQWSDNMGRSGNIDLSGFNYTVGEEVEVVDGIFVKFNDGTIVQNDEFILKAKPDESGLWYVPEEDEPSKIYEPTPWRKKNGEEGNLPTASLSGNYTGEDDTFYFKVKEAGIVGKSERVIVEYTSDEGKSGELALGLGYEPNSEIEVSDGLKVSFPSEILLKGATTEFDVEEPASGFLWWFNNGDMYKGRYPDSLEWSYPEDSDGEMDLNQDALRNRDVKRSNINPVITGVYTGDRNKEYTLTVEGNGIVGKETFLNIYWEDSEGKSGRIKVDDTYNAGEAIELDEGLKLTVPYGDLRDGDVVKFNAFSPVIQPGQDAAIRVNATMEGGGLVMRSGDGIFKNAIEGVTLEAIKPSEEIVTVTIENDLNSPRTAISEFVISYNALLGNLKEVSKYDPETKIAGPLQADNNVHMIHNTLSEIMIDAVKGLPREANMATYAGITVNKTGQLDFDEQKFDTKLSEDIEKVAKIFSVSADSTIKGIELLDLTDKTTLQEDEVDFEITQLATKGVFVSGVLGDFIWLNDKNDTYSFSVNGKQTEEIQLMEGVYNRKEFLHMMKNTLKDNPALAEMNFDVEIMGDRLVIRSDTYGSTSEVSVFTPLEVNEDNSDFALINGESIIGKNVQGKIDNIDMEGSGKILRGIFGTKLEGLRLYAELPPEDYTVNETGDLLAPLKGKFVLTRGIGSRSLNYTTRELQKDIGVNVRISNIRENITEQKKRLDRVNERIDIKKTDLVKQFTNMESAISSLKSQQSDTMSLLNSV